MVLRWPKGWPAILCGGNPMSTAANDEWMQILSRLNSILLQSNVLRGNVPQQALSTGWCGLPPATESEIIRTEKRLGISLPPSYRSFLSISNGWRPFSTFIASLSPVEEIDRFQSADPQRLAMVVGDYQEDELSDDEYLDYQTPEHMVALRLRYFPESVLVGKPWGSESDIVLLNPSVVFPNGELEAIFFANWLPGNLRYRSFRDLVEEGITDLERSENPPAS